LGGTLQAFATVAAAGSNNPTVMALQSLSIGYYIAFSFILVVIAEGVRGLFRLQQQELKDIERELDVLTKALANSNLDPERQRIIWRDVSRRLIQRIAPAQRNEPISRKRICDPHI
jgi:hypothetical protein